MISIGKKEIVVNIGYKSEGVIGASEFRYNWRIESRRQSACVDEKQEDANGGSWSATRRRASTTLGTR